VSQDLATRLRRLEQQIRAFKELHATELGLILDELTDIAAQVEAEKRDAVGPAPAVDPADPAAASPKRAKWLAEQERKAAPKSRRELLFRGREDET
jgi:hypothetical protein